MTRRDIIIVAILVNTGLVALLFMMAINTDDDKVSEPVEIVQTIQDNQPTEIPLDQSTLATPVAQDEGLLDEGDNALKAFEASQSETETLTASASHEEEPVQDLDQDEDLPKVEAPKPVQQPEPKVEKPAKTAKTVEVTVKSGDSLDKIARANGTTIKAIKDANQLKTDKLSIGQVLKVPVGDKKTTTAAKSKKSDNQVASADSQYYTVKSGDNPWKIAKQLNLKVEDLLKLNNMSEEKARNMKVGDKIRIK